MDVEAAQKGLDNRTSAGDMIQVLEAFFTSGHLAGPERLRAIEILKNQQSCKLTAAIEEGEVLFYGKSGELAGLQADAGVFSRGEILVFAAVFVEGADNPLEAQLLIAKIGLLIHTYMKQAL